MFEGLTAEASAIFACRAPFIDPADRIMEITASAASHPFVPCFPPARLKGLLKAFRGKNAERR